MRKLAILASCVLVSVSIAQTSKPQIEVGYTRSNTFDLRGGGRGSLEGLEVGLSQPVIKLPLIGEARLGVSMLFGGTMAKSSEKGNVFRFSAMYMTPNAGPSGFYGVGGFFYGSATGSSFDSVTGFGLVAGIGFPITKGVDSLGVPGVPKLALELKMFQGARAHLRGFSLGLSGRF
ncbi:MAG: hypothetical protein ABL949_07895 [Fimbriimonadaceae bacterium]